MTKTHEQPIPRAKASGDSVPTPEVLQTYSLPPIPMREIIKYRTQNDGLDDLVSEATAIAFDPANHMTRQEFGPETEIHWILNHYGVATSRRTPQYPDIDFSIDLQQAIEMQRTLDSANIVAPPELKEKYPNKYAILAGIESGAYEKDLQELEVSLQAKRHEKELRAQNAQGPAPQPLTQPKPTEQKPVGD